ncbi:MAG TPA: hypothetical protein DHW71_08705 [Gammaproteobacteria bacterium]|nr:hypothetical protein [Gammaproteobacteria bacterium]HBF06648.1 hypothetical protein [Gammaproteobacteria bacterium]HCK93053.1 hypothetical protein [Gammaproteobacteria bacterium]|tara:strand:- start:731 stop:1189 length:459 start_codon:yes stop_codon:yes gene_type:complete
MIREKLRLAISDMAYVNLMECELRDIDSNPVLRDAVRTACVMVYARPFTGSIASNNVYKRWLKQYDERIKKYLNEIEPRLYEVHQAIIEERNTIISHNDYRHHSVNGEVTSQSECFKTFTHKEFNKVNLLMEKFLKSELVRTDEKYPLELQP